MWLENAYEVQRIRWVKCYNETKGYGFIQPDSDGKDIFVHASALERAKLRGLAEGQKVFYDVEVAPARSRPGT